MAFSSTLLTRKLLPESLKTPGKRGTREKPLQKPSFSSMCNVTGGRRVFPEETAALRN